MTAHSNLRGILAMLGATGTFVANDSCMKLAMAEVPPLEVLILRGISACLWCLPILLILGHARDLPRIFNPWVMLRCLSEGMAILCFIFALQHMPIGDLTALVQITPFLVLIGVRVIWGERIGPLRLLLIAVGICGALLVAQPGSSAASPFALFGFATAVGAAGRDIISRKVPADVPALVVTFAVLLFVMAIAAAGSLLFERQVMPSWRHAGLMTIAGFFLMCGHLLIFLAYRYAPARVVAPFSYGFAVWAVIAGFVLFNDVPNALALAGMGLIVLSGLAVILFDGRTRQGEVRQAPS